MVVYSNVVGGRTSVPSTSVSPAEHVKGATGAKVKELTPEAAPLLLDDVWSTPVSTPLVSVQVSGLQLFTPTHPKSSTSNHSACTDWIGAIEATPTTIAKDTNIIPRFLIFEFILVL
ncbi:hypothetical protein [Candidatus Nitrosocosmicus arcticus]|uniref:hypothetical protein n=1 Tax=Candidatus Nitrosocosmicus arcticus TaxID=2035267 RepID=UPI0011A71A41|nr:hypothetical protein [Candidatus Nitrosocosmicus arcticus]